MLSLLEYQRNSLGVLIDIIKILYIHLRVVTPGENIWLSQMLMLLLNRVLYSTFIVFMFHLESGETMAREIKFRQMR